MLDGRNSIAGLIVALVLAAPAAAAPVPEGATWTEATIVSGDGTKLHADVLRSSHVPVDRKVPVIVNVGPYNGTGPIVNATVNGTPPDDGPAPGYPELYGKDGLFARGYAYVQVDLRGYGDSEGCGDLTGPKERADVKAAVEWAASQPWSTGRVGMWGKSYDGWAGMAAIAERAKGLQAVVTMAPMTALRLSHEQSEAGVAYTGWRAVPAYNVLLQADPPRVPEPSCYSAALAGVQHVGPSPFWAERDLRPSLAGARVPVLYSQGLLETSVRADHATTAWPLLSPRPRLWVGQFDHVRPYREETGRDGFIEEALRFFDRHVRHVPAKQAPVERDPQVTVQDSAGRWRAESAWPPADARDWTMPVRPGAFRSEDRNFGESTFKDPATRAAHPAPGPFGVGTWTATAPLPHDARIAGVPRVDVDVSTVPAGAHLVALLYDVEPTGRAVLIARGPTALEGSGKATVSLTAQDWHIAKGHRLALLLSGADDGVYEPPSVSGKIAITSGRLILPLLTNRRTSFLAGDASPDIARRGAIQVSPQTLDAATVPGAPPPMQEARPRPRRRAKRHLRVSPRSVRAGRPARFVFLVRRGTKPLPGATVRIGRHRLRTGRDGRARMRLRFRRPGRVTTRSGSATAVIRVRPNRRARR